jgi:glucose-6-phosphate isomerase
MKQKEDFSALAAQYAAKKGTVTYITNGMYAPGMYSPDGRGTPADVITGPYVTQAANKQALALAQEKLAYLKKSRDPAANKSPDSFLDLRDGGNDTAGLPGFPVMTGWLTYAQNTLGEAAFLDGLMQAGEKIRRDFSGFLSIGIGGSYTDVEGIVSALAAGKPKFPMFYLGQHLSAEEYHRVFEEIKKLPGKVAVNIISKSGTTTEPAIAARISLSKLEAMGKLGAVFATTDPAKGALREMAATRGFNPPEYLPPEAQKLFFVGEDIGGRFSCITPVGLLPYAVAGIDIRELLLGYVYGISACDKEIAEITACRYAAFQAGAPVAVYAYNVARFRGKILSYRQLWPESTGKAGKGLNIMEEFYTADAHSNGQLVKSGVRNMMEVFHFIGDIGIDFQVPTSEWNADKLDTIAGSIGLHEIDNLFMAALFLDHWKSGVPVMAVKIPALTPFLLGMHTAMEHASSALFGLMTGVNPVNQPGVQGYKEIAFRLLGIKGEAEKAKAKKELEDFGIL